MNEPMYQALEFGITRIDAGYVRPGMACFYLMEEGGECAVIETGTSRSVPVLEELLRQRGIARQQVRFIIPTHVHLDHAGGCGVMMAAFPEAQLLIHPRGARHMADPQRLISGATEVYGQQLFGQLYGEVLPVPRERIREMADRETVELAGRPLEFRHTRGHAEHHFCVWDETSRGWFSGDMFGVSYPWCRSPASNFVLPSTTPTQFDPESYLASLELLGRYAPQRMYLTHFGQLEYSRDAALLLVRQISAYCELAVAYSADGERLQQRLIEYSLGLLEEIGAFGSAAELEAYLAFDMQLNAQGLQAWQQRIAGN